MSLEAMKRHLGKPKMVEIGEDKFAFPPLPLEYLPELYGNVISNIQGEDEQAIMKNMSKEVMKNITDLITVSCERSPDVDTSDQSILDAFISANFITFMTALIEVNIPQEGDTTKQKLLQKHAKNKKPIGKAKG